MTPTSPNACGLDDTITRSGWARRRRARSSRRLGALVSVAVVLAACQSSGAAHDSSSRAQDAVGSGPCIGAATPAWKHVVWVWFENKAADAIIGSGDAPYVNELADRCGSAANYAAIRHPSLPNYIAATSGDTQGVTGDGPPATYELDAPSIFSELGSTGWRSYQESMRKNCDATTTGPIYAVRHNPAAYYLGIRAACATQDVPLSYPLDLSAAFTFVTPDLCSDMHDCSVSTGDQWLADFVEQVTATKEFTDGTTALFITWDEDDHSRTDTGSDNQVPLLVVAPSVRAGTTVATAYDHYSLLRTTQEMLGLRLLGRANDAASMRTAFHL